jgi:protein-S-isoprenylcysteine O-methyltransferase Ste14
MANDNCSGGKPADGALFRFLISHVLFLFFVALALFIPGGNDWTEGWIFLSNLILQLAIAGLFLWYKNPQIFIARSRFHEGTKSWDWAAISILILSFMAIFAVAGLHHGSSLPVIASGHVLLTVGIAGMTWVQAVNPFAEPSVRIQPGQRVIDTGPYAIVRHPMYSVSFPAVAGIALSLGSYWALLPAAVVGVGLLARTALEDRMLQRELPGYQEYARRVQYRILPGVW